MPTIEPIPIGLRAIGDRLRELMPVTVDVAWGAGSVKVTVGGKPLEIIPVAPASVMSARAESVGETTLLNGGIVPIYRNPPWHPVGASMSLADLGQVVDWGLTGYGVQQAWKVTKGEGALIAILDTGAQVDHPDLVGQFAEEPKNFTSSPGAWDVAGHGTHVSGIIAASDNGQGMVGVAPKAQLLIGKVLGDDGSGYGEWIAAGLDWAVSQGAHIISMSLGSPYPDPIIWNGIKRATEKGCLVICAAGNSGPHNPTDIDYPGRFEEVVAVASIMRGGALSQFSSRGPHVALAAPGQEILSTFPQSRYQKLSGTSMATPFIAGVAGLLVSAKGALTRGAFMDLVKPHLIDAGEPGLDNEFGYGIVDVGDLLQLPPPVVKPPVVPPTDPGGWQIGAVRIHFPAVATDDISFKLT